MLKSVRLPFKNLWKIRPTSVLIPLVMLFMLISFSFAQDDDSRVLIPGEPVDSGLNAENAAQVFLFTPVADDAATLVLTPQAGLSVTMVLTDENGRNIAQVIGDGTNETRIEAVAVGAGMTYYVTVFPTAGLENPGTGFFLLALDLASTNVDQVTEPTEPEITQEAVAEATLEPLPTVVAEEIPETTTTRDPFQPNAQVILNNGIQVNLNWDTTDDLNLQIRDPNGGTLFWDSRSTIDGGTFGPDVNGLCQVITEPPATETATWPGGPLQAGSYEILVYYRQACEGNDPVNFTVSVNVDGVEAGIIEGSLLPPINDVANVFLSSFVVNQSDGSVVIGAEGPYTDTRDLAELTTSDLLALEATPILLEQPLEGLITSERPFQTYAFEGLGDQTVNISMTALNGNLDTLLLVLDSAGNIIADNDDVQPVVNTNSAIQQLRLPVDDVYTIVASRYGKVVGGTEGNFEIAVTGSELPPELAELNLPDGDIEITLTWAGDVDIQLLVRDPSGNAVFDDEPTAPSGGRLTAQGNVNCVISETQPVSYIYWPEGFGRIGSYEIEVWYQSECNNVGLIVDASLFIVYQNQLVFSDTVSLEFGQRYLTSFFIDPSNIASPSAAGIIGGSETLNYQDEIASAVQINTGQSVPGSITADDKFDLYTFQGQAGQTASINMTATSATLDTLLFLIDPNGIEIATNDDVADSTNSAIENILLSQDGEYTIIATHYGAAFGGTIGGYNLTLTLSNS